MNQLAKYILVFGFLCFFTLIIFDSIIMPRYIRKSHSIPLINLKNKSVEKAIEILESEGFKGVIKDSIPTNSILPGIVMEQHPKPYARVKIGRTVRLSVSQPERLIEVPYLIGLSKRNGELTLNLIGLKIDTVYFEYHPYKKEGTIVWQNPKAGDILRKGNGIHIEVSKGKPPNFFIVPDIVTLLKSEAEVKLKEAGLSIGEIKYIQDSTLVRATVLSQSIIQGTVLEKSTPVDITISVETMQDIINLMMEK